MARFPMKKSESLVLAQDKAAGLAANAAIYPSPPVRVGCKLFMFLFVLATAFAFVTAAAQAQGEEGDHLKAQKTQGIPAGQGQPLSPAAVSELISLEVLPADVSKKSESVVAPLIGTKEGAPGESPPGVLKKTTPAYTLAPKEGIKQGVPGASPPEQDANQKTIPVESSTGEVTSTTRAAGDYGQTKQADDKRKTIK